MASEKGTCVMGAFRTRADGKKKKADRIIFFQPDRGIGDMGRQSARVAFFVTTSGLYVSAGGSDGFTVLAEMFPFRLTFRTETRRFFFRFRRSRFGRCFRGIAEGVPVLCLGQRHQHSSGIVRTVLLCPPVGRHDSNQGLGRGTGLPRRCERRRAVWIRRRRGDDFYVA